MADPQISVVIPVRDEAATIGALLDSLAKQTQSPQEIIIVDAGSTDETAERVKTHARTLGLPVRVLTPGPAYPGIARNIGARLASADYLAFTDAGIRLDPHWLERLSDALRTTPWPDVVFGTYEPAIHGFFDRCAATTYVPARTITACGPVRGPSIASCLVRRSVWEAVGGFPPWRAAEDLIFIEKVVEHGFSIAYAPAAVVHWQMAPGLWRTYRRFANYSYHNLVAGRGRYWHRGVLRFYVAALPFVVLAGASRLEWVYIPIAGFIARVAAAIWRKRNEDWGSMWNPFRWVMVGAILLTLDVATFTGTARWGVNKLSGRLPDRLISPENETA